LEGMTATQDYITVHYIASMAIEEMMMEHDDVSAPAAEEAHHESNHQQHRQTIQCIKIALILTAYPLIHGCSLISMYVMNMNIIRSNYLVQCHLSATLEKKH